MVNRESSLSVRLSRYMELSAAERDSLDWAERREVRLQPGAILLREGTDNDSLFVVQRGWLHSSVQVSNGTRQILRFHFAGDIMGTSGVAWLPAVHSLTAVSECTVSELSKVNLARLFREQSRLAGLLYAMAAAESVTICDRLAAVARLGAKERVGLLLLDILARLRVTSLGVVRSFDMPLTQGDVGDAVGLTKVHVNRMMGQLEAERLIERQGRRITILDEDSLIRQTGFVDRYAAIDTSWLMYGSQAA